MAISPTTKNVGVGLTATFTTAGGIAPLTYSVSSGSGSIGATSGIFTAPSTAGTTVVTVTDAAGTTSSATITTYAAPTLSPSSKTTVTNALTTFTGSGGYGALTYSLLAGTGAVDATSGVYTAPASAGNATVRVTDSLGSTQDAAVTVNAGVSISPTAKTLAVTNTYTFAAVAGISPYTYSVYSGSGSIGASSGVFTAASSAGTAVIRVTDSVSATADATVTVNAALAISPTSQLLSPGSSLTYSFANGGSSCTYSLFSGSGAINSTSGAYTSASTAYIYPESSGTDVIRATDDLGNTSNSTVTLITATKIVASGTNARISDDQFGNATNGGRAIGLSGSTLIAGATQQDYDADGANGDINTGAVLFSRILERHLGQKPG